MWIAERVWEQSLVASIVEAGIEYTILDDTHFRRAGCWRLSKYHLPHTSDRVSRLTLQFGDFPKRNLWTLYPCF